MTNENQKLVNDYEETMQYIMNKMEKQKSKQELLWYLDALKTTIAFTLKTTRQTMKGKK